MSRRSPSISWSGVRSRGKAALRAGTAAWLTAGLLLAPIQPAFCAKAGAGTASDQAAPPVDKTAALKQLVKLLLYMTDADYRKAMTQLPPGDARAPQLASRSTALKSVCTTLAALEYDQAAGKAGEGGDPKYAKAYQDLRERDAEAVGIDPKTMQETGWAMNVLKWLGSAALNYWLMGAPLLVGRDLGPVSETTRLGAQVDELSGRLSEAGLSPERAADLHYQTGAAYEKLASAAGEKDSPDAEAAKKEARLKQLTELLESVSDEDFKTALGRTSSKGAGRPELASRAALLKSSYMTLAALEYKQAASQAPVEAGAKYSEAYQRVAGGPEQSLAIDPESLQETGWASDLLGIMGMAAMGGAGYLIYKNQRRHRGAPSAAQPSGPSVTETPSEPATPGQPPEKKPCASEKNADGGDCGKGGRSELLGSADKLQTDLAGAKSDPDRRAALHYELGSKYESLAALKLVIAKKPEPPAAPEAEPKARRTKEDRSGPAGTPQGVYRAAGPGVVLLMCGDSEGNGELGTGSLIDVSGKVLTNAHVAVSAASGQPYEQVRVYFKPARLTGDPKKDLAQPRQGSVLAYDRDLDLALIDVGRPPAGASVIPLGDSDAVEPGEAVVAIGHPEQGGLWTLTQGVVSTVVADLGGVRGKDAFQTDASINRGNSGGPLLDLAGRQIGVNTSMARKAPDGLAITSVNFSLKSEVAKKWLSGQGLKVEEGRAGAATAPSAPAAKEPPAAVAQAPEAPAEAPVAAKSPSSEPEILTPKRPYRIDELRQTMAEMEEMGRSMHEEILRRKQGR